MVNCMDSERCAQDLAPSRRLTLQTSQYQDDSITPQNTPPCSTPGPETYHHAPEDFVGYAELLRWPLILKPRTDKSCVDKRTFVSTVPITVVNITSLFEVLHEGVSEMDLYLTSSFLTSLDSYYKLSNFSFDSYVHKNSFLNDIINYLQSFSGRTDIENNLNNVKNRISFSNDGKISWGSICNKRIYDEMPIPAARAEKEELVFRYVGDAPCAEGLNGVVGYRIESLFDADVPQVVAETLKGVWSYANKARMFQGIDWEKIERRRRIVEMMMKALEEGGARENQAQVLTYLEKYLKHNLMSSFPPTVEKECVVPVRAVEVVLTLPTQRPCVVSGFHDSFNEVFKVDVMTLFGTLRRVEVSWMQKLVPLLTSSNAAAMLELTHPITRTKGELLEYIVEKLGVTHPDIVPSTLVEVVKSEIDPERGAGPVDVSSNCPKRTSPNLRLGSTSCELKEAHSAKLATFINIPTLLSVFRTNTPQYLLSDLQGVLNKPNAHTLLPPLDIKFKMTLVTFLENILKHFENQSSSPTYKKYFQVLLDAINTKDTRELGVSMVKTCVNPHFANGQHLRYPSTVSCTLPYFDLDLQNILSGLDPTTSQSQVIHIATYFINKQRNFYEVMSTVDTKTHKTVGAFLKATIDEFIPIAENEESNLFNSLLPHILVNESQPLKLLGECYNDDATLEHHLDFYKLKTDLEMASDFIAEGTTNSMPSETTSPEQKRLKALLYKLLGDKESLKDTMNIMQKTDLNAEKMYEGLDVIDELPEKYEVVLLLKRYLKAVESSADKEVILAVKIVLANLHSDTLRRKRNIRDPSFNLEELLQATSSDLPEKIKEATRNLTKSLHLRNVTISPVYEDLIPFIRMTNVRTQISILLKIIHETDQDLSTVDLANIKQVHNYFSPDENDFVDVDAHYKRVVYLLNNLVQTADGDLIRAKEDIVVFLDKQKYFDKVRIHSVEPKEYLVRSLLRLREILNRRYTSDGVKIWVATTKILHFLNVSDGELMDSEVDEDLDVVGFFRGLNGTGIAREKGVMLKYILQHLDTLREVFSGMGEVENSKDFEKISIVLSRMEKMPLVLTDKEKKAFEKIRRFVRGDEQEIDLESVLDEVFQGAKTKKERLAKELVLKEMKESSRLHEEFNKDELSKEEVLRTLLKRLSHDEHSQHSTWAVKHTLRRLQARQKQVLESMATVLQESIPNTPALQTILHLMRQRQPDFLYNAHQPRLIIHRLNSLPGLTEEEIKALQTIRDYLDANDIGDELGELMSKVFEGDEPPKHIVQARNVVLHYLSSGYLHKGVDFHATPLKTLTQIFNNVLQHRGMVHEDLVKAIRLLEEYLLPRMSNEKNGAVYPTALDDFEGALSGVSGAQKEALRVILHFARSFPSALGRMLGTGSPEGDIVDDILQGFLRYEPPSTKLKGAATLLKEYRDNETRNKIRRKKSVWPRVEEKDEQEKEEAFEQLKKEVLILMQSS